MSGYLNQNKITKMGNLVSSNQEEINELIKGQYQILDYPYLLHRSTQQLATIYKITTRSQFQSKKIIQIIEEYKHTKCESILKLRSHYYINRSGYCSDEQNYYLVFQGRNDYSLHEEYLKRRLQGKTFKEKEIIQIIETYLTGLKQYDHRFQSQYQNLLLSSIIIDQQSLRMYLKNPFISRNQFNNQFNDKRTKLLISYPSPQKLNTTYNSNIEDYNVFLSNLFSIGMIALELTNLEFVDDIYIKKKDVNYDLINQKINQLKDSKLRRGVECLINFYPSERKKIYQIWGIENKDEHYLQYSTKVSNKTNSILTDPEIIIKSPLQYQRQNTQAYQLNSKPFLNIPQQPNNPTFIVPKLNIPSNPINYNSNSVKFTPLISDRINYISQPMNSINLPSNEPKQLFNAPNSISFNNKRVNPSNSEKTKYSFKTNQYDNSSQQVILGQKPLLFQDFMKKQNQSYRFELTKNNQPNNLKFNNVNSLTTAPTITNISSPSPNNLNLQPNYQSHNQISMNLTSKPIQYKYHSNATNIQPGTQAIINSNTSSNISGIGNLGPIKQSITYYDHSSNRTSNAQNVPTYLQNFKQRQIKSILIEEKKENLPKFNKKKEDYIQPITLDKNDAVQIVNNLEIIQNQQSKATQSIQSPIVIKNQQQKIQEKNQIQEIKSNTPQKPTTKNKYNSTIVQVRDQDSPDHSFKSQEGAIEEEYVVEEYETGSRYQGFKSNNMRNGRGKFYYQDGGYYQGQWKNNKMDGYGKLYYEGGKLAYEGSWYQDQFNGQGKVYNDNPVHLSVPFDYTNFDELEDYWQYYEGTLARDTKEGRGRIKLSNGQLFEGDFHNDRIQGFGKFYTIDNRVVEGIWRQSHLIKIIKSD